MRTLEKRIKELEMFHLPRHRRVIRLIEDGGVRRTFDGSPMPEIQEGDLVIVRVIIDPPGRQCASEDQEEMKERTINPQNVPATEPRP